MNPLIGIAVSDLEMSLRLLIAALCGAGVGYQREHANKAAGFRTHILVALGSALFTVVSLFGFGDRADPARVAAQVVVGIGFIGAGAILHSRTTVTGLTTAASIWVTAAIGMAAGVGLYFVTVVTTAIVLIVLQLQKHREVQVEQSDSAQHEPAARMGALASNE
jgi:putative Mg2+ transporter-C (MgtC) family protein